MDNKYMKLEKYTTKDLVSLIGTFTPKVIHPLQQSVTRTFEFIDMDEKCSPVIIKFEFKVNQLLIITVSGNDYDQECRLKIKDNTIHYIESAGDHIFGSDEKLTTFGAMVFDDNADLSEIVIDNLIELIEKAKSSISITDFSKLNPHEFHMILDRYHYDINGYCEVKTADTESMFKPGDVWYIFGPIGSKATVFVNAQEEIFYTSAVSMFLTPYMTFMTEEHIYDDLIHVEFVDEKGKFHNAIMKLSRNMYVTPSVLRKIPFSIFNMQDYLTEISKYDNFTSNVKSTEITRGNVLDIHIYDEKLIDVDSTTIMKENKCKIILSKVYPKESVYEYLQQYHSFNSSRLLQDKEIPQMWHATETTIFKAVQ